MTATASWHATALASEGIDVRHVTITGRTATGVALIAVDPAGENQISVAPGANATVAAGMVEAALDDLAPTVVLASLEVPEARCAPQRRGASRTTPASW